MTEYRERPTNVGESTSNGVSPGRGKVRLRLGLEDNSEGAILNLRNVYYLPNSPCILVSLGLLNDSGIYHNNEQETLYHVESKRILTQARRWRNSYLLRPLNLSDGAVHLLKVGNNDYQWPPHALRSVVQPKTTPLSIWHKRLGHPNFPALKAHLNRINIPYTDDSSGYICDSCLRAKATKIYCRDPQKRAERPYQYIHTDLVGPINPIGFAGERYFFTFTDDATRMTDTYTGTRKSDWLKCLKAYHRLCRTRSKNNHPSAPYSQEQNGVSERMGRTIMDMTRATILEGNIDDDLWHELVLAMTYVKNSRPTRALPQNLSPYEALTQDHPNISHLRILGSTVYVFLHEEEQSLKSEKWAPRALKGTLVGYDGHTIYRVYIKEQNKVIRVKDLRIFEDYESKSASELPDYNNGTPTFQGFNLDDNDDEKEENSQTGEGRKVNIEQPGEGRKVSTEEAQQRTPTRDKGRKVTTAEHIPSTTKSRSGRTVKLSAKAQETKTLAHQKQLSPIEQSSEIEKHPSLLRSKARRLRHKIYSLL